jgi:hypothetical protein
MYRQIDPFWWTGSGIVRSLVAKEGVDYKTARSDKGLACGESFHQWQQLAKLQGQTLRSECYY